MEPRYVEDKGRPAFLEAHYDYLKDAVSPKTRGNLYLVRNATYDSGKPIDLVIGNQVLGPATRFCDYSPELDMRVILGLKMAGLPVRHIPFLSLDIPAEAHIQYSDMDALSWATFDRISEVYVFDISSGNFFTKTGDLWTRNSAPILDGLELGESSRVSRIAQELESMVAVTPLELETLSEGRASQALPYLGHRSQGAHQHS